MSTHQMRDGDDALSQLAEEEGARVVLDDYGDIDEVQTFGRLID